MKTRSAMGTALVLLMAAAAPANLLQVQSFNLCDWNGVLVAGQGAQANTVVQTVGQVQNGSDNGGLFRAVQGQAGGLALGAGAAGIGGVFGVLQVGGLGGLQTQVHLGGPLNLGNQTQGANVGLLQGLTNMGGNGVAIGMGVAVGVQVQVAASPFGGSINVQPVVASVVGATGK